MFAVIQTVWRLLQNKLVLIFVELILNLILEIIGLHAVSTKHCFFGSTVYFSGFGEDICSDVTCRLTVKAQSYAKIAVIQNVQNDF